MLVVVLDVMLMPVLLQSGLFFQLSTTAILAIDFGIVALTGITGLIFASRIGAPSWWQSGRDGSSASRRTTYVTVLLAISIVVTNTLVNLTYLTQATQLPYWLTLLTPGTAVALSLRAALTEEIVFRLFLFLLATWAIERSTHSQKRSMIVGALASAFMFALMHGSGFAVAFPLGLALVYIYHRRGLLPAMTVHFFADAIPFASISIVV